MKTGGGAGHRPVSGSGAALPEALDLVAAKLQEAGGASAFLATPQATNEDLFVFRALAEKAGGSLDFRVGDPQDRVQTREDHVLLRADRNPNTMGCLELGLGRSGVASILAACERGDVKVLVLQGPEILKDEAAAKALARVPFIAVMATHELPGLEAAHVVLPAAVWAEMDGTFTNYQRRVQRIRRAVPAPGDALPRWELAAALLGRLGAPLQATSAREVFVEMAKAVPALAGLDHRLVGSSGRQVGEAPAAAAPEARA
jgi:predicted molibdopterin-dependent oxidoreductase YjgC